MDDHVEIRVILQKAYGLDISHIKSLPGYDDINFLIESTDGQKYVFKLADTDTRISIKVQCEVLDFLSNKDHIQAPHIIRNQEGLWFFEAVYRNHLYLARLQTYLNGELLSFTESFSSALISNFGQFLAKLDIYLSTYEGVLPPEKAFIWNIKYTSLCRQYYSYIRDDELRRLVQYFVLQFEEKVKPQLCNLPTSLIHADAHTWNVLAKHEQISGIIDFGDLAYTNTIFEVAIALAYLTIDADDIFQTCAIFLKAYHEVAPLGEDEIALLYYMITARLSISLSMSSFKSVTEPQNEYAAQDRNKTWKYIKKWHQINPLLFENRMREACNYPGKITSDISHLLAIRKSVLSEAQSISYELPIHMTAASMQYMYDDQGNTYLDCVNNICHVGHCHPLVVEAGQRQMARLNTNTRYVYEALSDYASRLLSKFPDPLNKVFFVNSGSAATDLAYRIVKAYTGSNNFIVVSGGYHGNTAASIDLSPYKFDGKGGSGSRSFVHKLSLPDTFRGKYPGDDKGLAYASEVDTILDSYKIAGFICESILGCGGQIVLPELYLKTIYDKIREQGGLCTADEVQTGFGRVGTHFWAFELYDVIPDIVILGKPMGNGHPMGAVVTTEAVCNAFENGMEYFSSFGGNPVSCEIGNAVLNVIESENLQANALQTGEYVINQWQALKEKHSCIGDIRGEGLFLGMELVKDNTSKTPDPLLTRKIVEAMKNRYFLLSTDGPDQNVIKFKPPLVFNKENADHLAEQLDRVINEICQ